MVSLPYFLRRLLLAVAMVAAALVFLVTAIHRDIGDPRVVVNHTLGLKSHLKAADLVAGGAVRPRPPFTKVPGLSCRETHKL